MINLTSKNNKLDFKSMRQQVMQKQSPVKIPPIKIQGIKSKLVPFILSNIKWNDTKNWIEPFLGSGVVMFNALPRNAIASELNPHIIKIYKDIQRGKIKHADVRNFLEIEGAKLLKNGDSYYYEVRDRFNSKNNSLDFLFLNRSCFNGLMRFNSKSKFNVPFCKKPNRFSKSYITKITNQVYWVQRILKERNWIFQTMDWKESLENVKTNDFLYLDPPYYGRNTNYYDVWDQQDIHELADFLNSTKAKFALSLWYKNKYRTNKDIKKYFSEFTIKKYKHFYHLGSTENLRNSMTEVLIMKI